MAATSSPDGRGGGTCVFVDTSGSTAGCARYQRRVAEVLARCRAAEAAGGPRVRVFTWADECRDARLEDVLRNAGAGGGMRGEGGTSVAGVTSFIERRELAMDTLVLVTDGEIPRLDALRAARDVRPTWGRTEAHLVTAGPPDASVVAAFVTGVPYELHGPDGALVARTSLDAARCAALVAGIGGEAQLADAHDELHAFLAALTLGRDAPLELREAVLAMRARVLRAAAATAAAAADADADADAYEREGVPAVLARVERLAAEFYAGGASDLARRLDRLVTLCTCAGDFSLDRLCAARAERLGAPVAPPVEAAEVPDVAECEWDDSILMDTTHCVLLPIAAEEADDELDDEPDAERESNTRESNTRGGGLLGSLPARRAEALVRCPLLALAEPAFVAALRARLLAPLSREVVALLAPGSPHPFSRRRMAREFVVFGAGPLHERCNRACLARLLGGGARLSGSFAQWMLVLWRVAADVEFVARATSAPTCAPTRPACCARRACRSGSAAPASARPRACRCATRCSTACTRRASTTTAATSCATCSPCSTPSRSCCGRPPASTCMAWATRGACATSRPPPRCCATSRRSAGEPRPARRARASQARSPHTRPRPRPRPRPRAASSSTARRSTSA
jgi:hypothetical protein